MSVAVTTLKSGINVVTDTMPHLETASLGVWVNSGSRDERRDEHGISHFLEHMAFKGTRRRTRAPDRRGDRGRRRRSQCGDRRRDHGLLRARAQGRRAAGARRALRHPVRAGLRPRRARPRAERHRPGDRRRRRHAGRSDFRASASHRFPGPAARPLDSRHRQDGAVVRRRQAARLSRPGTIARPTSWWPPPAPSIMQAVVAEVERRFASFNGPASPLPEPAQASAAAATSRSASSNRCTSRWRFPAWR